MNKHVLLEEAAAEPRSRPSKLHADLARRILRRLKEQGAGPGYHLVELELCNAFDVSRTPVRGALRLLAEQGMIEARANRGYVLVDAVREAPELLPSSPVEDEDQALFIAIAEGRNSGRIPDQCSQQELVRLLGAKVSSVVRVLRQLAALGLVERKPGNGWSFAAGINSARARADSYAFRKIVEPAGLLEEGFELDREWAGRSIARHMAFRKRKWRETMAVELFEINADFHEQLARCSGNRYLLDAVQRQNRLRTFLNIQWVNGPERVEDSIDEHLTILAALASGDNRRAAELMERHLDCARNVAPTIA
jgi:DNA-binding GntR family transcriptional regulator